MLVASTSVVGFGFRSGKLRTSKCLPICPRKRTYLPILERLPPPALGERRHRGLGRRVVAVLGVRSLCARRPAVARMMRPTNDAVGEHVIVVVVPFA